MKFSKYSLLCTGVLFLWGHLLCRLSCPCSFSFSLHTPFPGPPGNFFTALQTVSIRTLFFLFPINVMLQKLYNLWSHWCPPMCWPQSFPYSVPALLLAWEHCRDLWWFLSLPGHRRGGFVNSNPCSKKGQCWGHRGVDQQKKNSDKILDELTTWNSVHQ